MRPGRTRGAAGAAAPTAAWRLPGDATVVRLDGGLSVCLLSNRRAPVVTTALWYRVGTRDEAAGQGGIAHFLEHMMFKGATVYGPGAIDRRTQALGGDNNAFTSHDATVYHFNFAPAHWREALAIEADRMAGLRLDAAEVESERRVIVEEIAMYEADPWDSLDQRVHAARFPVHPYGKPVLGTARELASLGREELASFHAHFYRPGNAVLVVAGDVGEEDLAAVETAFAGVPPRSDEAGTAAAAATPPAPPAATPASAAEALGSGPLRVEQRKGEVPRLLVSLPAPAADHPHHPPLRIATVVFGSGRASRLYRRLVDEEQLCSWVTADLGETAEPGSLTVAAEVVPGGDPARVEAAVLEELGRLAEEPPGEAELERARKITQADWVMGHERVYQQALAAGYALALLGDLEHPARELRDSLAADGEEVAAVAERYLAPGGAVLGWSLPRDGEADEADDADEA